MAKVQYYGTGRRKRSVARVRLVPGDGKIVINNRDIEDYIPFAALREVVKQPLVETETLGTYDVLVNVKGGGYTGQAGAIRHGIARALLEVDPDYCPVLKRGLLTRDARMKERKKYGLKGAVAHHNSPNVNKSTFQRLFHFGGKGLFVENILPKDLSRFHKGKSHSCFHSQRFQQFIVISLF